MSKINKDMIHEKIKEVQDYFRDKLVNGDYVEIQNDSYKLWVQIDEEYIFILWIANGVSHLHTTYDLNDGGCNVSSFMKLELSDSDKEKIWSKRMDDIAKREEKRKADAELREYKRLQQKFESKKT